MKQQSKTAGLAGRGGFENHHHLASAATSDFQTAIAIAGLTPPQIIVPDGEIHRFASDGSPGDRAGWYAFHPDGVPSGVFGCFRLDMRRKWCARSRSELSPAERSELRRRVVDDWKLREEQKAKVRAEARSKSKEIWDSLPPADPGHPYLAKKEVGVHGIRQDGDRLVVPVRDSDGTLHGLQFIAANGDKWFLTGTAKKGNFHLLGQPGDVLVIAEGYATGASVHEATGQAVVVAIDAGNLKPVAEAIRLKYPNSSIIIAGDCDKNGTGHEKARAAAAASGGRIVIPEEPGDWNAIDGNGIDWNDVANSEGPEAVKATFAQAIAHAGDEAVMKRLAALSPAEYDRAREVEARKLGIRVTTLDAEIAKLRHVEPEETSGAGSFNLSDPEPWPEAVRGVDLLDSLFETIKRHVILADEAAVAATLWIIHSHAHDTAAISPILAVTSPTPECGKTTLLTLLIAMTPRPLAAANITPAAVFRSVEKWRPTLIVDEGDTFISHSQELRGVLDSGHNRMTASIIRTVGDDHEPRAFKTWAPKAIALIGKLPATLESRSIHVELRRIADGEHVNDLRGDRLADFEPLRRKCWRWACNHKGALKSAEPAIPAALRGRAADNWRHLLAIADLAGGEWPQKARAAAEKLSDGHDGKTAGIQLLEDIRTIFRKKNADKLSSGEIAAELGMMEDKPWPEWFNRKPISQTQIAKLLRPFRIVPGSIRIGTNTPNGYKLTCFEDAFRRYLPSRDGTTAQALKDKASRVLRPGTNQDLVPARKTPNALRDKACAVVPADGWELVGEGVGVDGTTVTAEPPKSRVDAGGVDDGTQPAPVPSDEVWTADEHEERAGHDQFDGGLPRIWAEALARLDPSRAPADVPPSRWMRFIDDCALFIDHWALRASRLGWTPLALFGCDRTRPFARFDRMGLLWLVDGRGIVELTADMAAIEIPGGERLTYRRKPYLEGSIAVWDLSQGRGEQTRPDEGRSRRGCTRSLT